MNFNPNLSSDEDHAIAEINIVPLVDVMLVLLIIFMVTAPLSISGVQVSLPKTKSSAPSLESERIVLSVTKSGQYYIEKMPVQSDHLLDKLKNIYNARQNKDLYIRADKGVLYGRVVEAMGYAKQAGAQKITMLTEHTN